MRPAAPVRPGAALAALLFVTLATVATAAPAALPGAPAQTRAQARIEPRADAPPEAPAEARPEARSEVRPRIRDLGVAPGVLEPGPRNTITDVAGVRVGHRTVIEGSSIRTGVTAILPHGGDLFREKVPAAVFVGNGFGKAAGFLQVDELGTLETPIVLTNTLAVGTAVRTVVAWTLEQPGHENVRSVNAVVGETNDGLLNDIRSLPIRPEHVRAAIQAAARSPEGAPVAEGSVGAGTGTRALGWKGGIGTASRRLPAELSGGGAGWTVGALVQSNFGGVLRIDGVPVGELLGRYSFRDVLEGEGADAADAAGRGESSGDGSCMIVLATDAPLDARNLGRLARRAVLALGRVGSFMSNGSGDFVVAFSTANRVPERSDGPVRELTTVRNDAVSPLFLAAVEAVEEAVYNSLTRAETVTGHRGRAEAIPVDRLREVLDEHRVRK